MSSRRVAPALSALAAALALASFAGWQAVPQTTSQTAKQSTPTIRVGTTLVDVPVLVLDKQGQPMDILSQGDFQVFDDGLPQKVTGFDNQPRPLSLAIVVDTSDLDAIGQAHRSAETITAMVVGAAGVASIFTPGPEPRQIVPFTSDANQLADALRHLAKSPTAPQGQGSIVEPLNLAMLDLKRQPQQNTRAALVISHSSAKGTGAEALVESGMSDAIPIFRLAPNRPKGAPAYVNPDSTDQRGTGAGSQREVAPPAPVDNRGQPTTGGGGANMDLGPVIGAVTGIAARVVEPHNLDYVYASGGENYSAGNDNDFDQKLSLIGDELRSIYHLYYTPNDLATQGALHDIVVKLDLPATANVGTIAHRRSYLGIQSH